MYFLYKCRVCGQTFTSGNYIQLSPAQAAKALRMLLDQNWTALVTYEDGTDRRVHNQFPIYRELICEHADGCGVADIQETTNVPTRIQFLAPKSTEDKKE